MKRTLFTGAAMAAVFLTPACAQEKIDTTDKAAIEKIVHDYIVANPEIIEEALIALSAKERAAEAERLAASVLENSEQIYNDPDDYYIGPSDAPVTLVEFFDYRCGYCKRSAEWAMDLPEKYDNQVRVVFKEYPILSPESEKAALAAIAAGKQGKYAEMHLALMQLDNKVGFGAEQIDDVARSVGVDVAKMRADMTSIDVQRAVSKSKSLARAVGIEGTPNFLIGTNVVPGANTDYVESLIEAELGKIG